MRKPARNSPVTIRCESAAGSKVQRSSSVPPVRRCHDGIDVRAERPGPDGSAEVARVDVDDRCERPVEAQQAGIMNGKDIGPPSGSPETNGGTSASSRAMRVAP